MTKPLVRLPPGKPVPAPLKLPAPFGAFVPFATSTASIMSAGGPMPMPSPWTIQGPSIQYPGGVVVGAPIGANMGSGTCNVQALYINGQPVDISPFITEALAVQSLNTLAPLTHTPAGAAFFFLIVNEKTFTLADPTPAFSLNGQIVNWTGPPNVNPGDEVVASYGTLHAPGATPPGAAYPSPLVPRMDGAASVGADGGFSRGDHVHPNDTSRAPIASPTFTGVPSAPTAALGTATTQLATTQFVANAIGSGGGGTAGVASWNTRTGAVTLQAADVTNVGGALTSSPAFTGTPTAPTALSGTNTTQIATTAFVMAALVSPALTGIPTAPTAAANTNSAQIATTAFVLGQASSAAPLMDGAAAAGTGTTWSRTDHVHPVDTSRAPLASPTFTGTPAAPTATAGTNTTQIATTAFVTAAVVASTTGVSQWNGRTGAVTMNMADVTAAGGAALASPAFTGTPTAPTASPGTSTTQLATTAFVAAAISGSVAGVASWNTRTGAVTLTLADVTGVGGAPLASPVFTGAPTAPTLTAGDSSTGIATTAFVMAAVAQPATVAPLMDGVAAVGTSLLYARQDHKHPSDTTLAPIASPTFTGAPAAPTPAPGNNTTALATTAFVTTAIAGLSFAPINSPTFTGVPSGPTAAPGTATTQFATTAFCETNFAASSAIPGPATVAPPMNGTAAVGTSTLYARQDHVHPTDTTLAPLASPVFTGTPFAPTAIAGTSTTQLATTAFVMAAIGALAAPPAPATVAPLMDGTAAVGTSALYARQDHVHPIDTSRAPLASPGLTGTPTAPTAVGTDNSTTIATTAFVKAALPTVPTTVAKVQLTACFAGLPSPSAVVVIPITFAMTIAASLAGSVGNVQTNPAASASFTVKSGSTTIGTISVNTSGTFSFSGSGGSLVAGNILTVTAPVTPDTAMANIGISLSATRS